MAVRTILCGENKKRANSLALASLLLTPFRTQNVPPPMSSCQLSVELSTSLNEIMRNRTPRHVTFSSEGDHIAVLHASGHIQTWNLRTRIEFSRSKTMDPINVCEIDISSLLEGWVGLDARQICMWRKLSTTNNFVVACLATGPDSDQVAILDVIGKEVGTSRLIRLASAGGRLMNSGQQIYWQSSKGNIITGKTFALTSSRLLKCLIPVLSRLIASASGIFHRILL